MSNSSEVIVYVNHPDEIVNKVKLETCGTDNLKYEDYVKLGKHIAKTVEVYQARLAYYACKVCQIRHGGKSNGFYTLTDYANDIGINRKTLQQWTLAYRNVLEKLDIPLEEVNKNVWKAANRVNDNLTWRNTIDNKNKGTHRAKLQYKKDTSKEDIQRMYRQELNTEPSFETELRSWCQTMRMIKNKIEKRDLHLAHEGNLIELMNNIDHVSDVINDFLTKKKNRKH